MGPGLSPRWAVGGTSGAGETCRSEQEGGAVPRKNCGGFSVPPRAVEAIGAIGSGSRRVQEMHVISVM